MRASLTVLVLCACRPDGLAIGVPWLEVPGLVEIDEARFGRANGAVVPITNSGTAEAWVEASTSPPFSAADALRVAPGTTADLAVVFVPDAFEPVEGLLTIRARLASWDVPIRATVDRDADDDGHEDLAAGGGDCDDGDPAIHPGVTEVCDGVDQDCDGVADDHAPEAPAWWPDDDDDGHGDPLAPSTRACEPPPGSVAVADDCDDALATAHPGAFEVFYDGVDQDCDGNDDDQDLDQDPFPADCDDLDPTVGPSAPELDDGLDQDCDGYADEDLWARGTLIVTELAIDPVAAPAPEGRWLEVYNPTDGHVDLGALVVTVGSQDSTPVSTWLAPGGVAVLCAHADPVVNGGVACDGTIGWSDDGARSVVVSVDGLDLDEVDWTGWAWQPGASAELRAASYDPDANDVVTAWCAATTPYGAGDLGTPGSIALPCP